MQMIRRLWRYAEPARGVFLCSSLVMSVRYFAINYLTAYLTGRITDAAQRWDASGILRDMAFFVPGLLVFVLVDVTAKYAHDVSTQRIANDLRLRAYSRVLHAPLWQVEMRGTSRGEVLSRLNHDVSAVENLYRSSLLAPCIFGIAGIGAFVSIGAVSWPVACFLLLLGLLSFLLQYGMSRRKKEVAGQLQGLLASLFTAAGECLTHGAALRVMNVRQGVLRYADRRLDRYAAAGRRDAAVKSASDMVVNGASVLQYVGVMLLALSLLARGRLAAAEIMYILSLSGLVVSAFTLVGNSLISLRGFLPALERVEEILAFEREELEQGEAWDGTLGGGLDLKNVSVCFTPEKKLSIPGTLHLPAGTATALYGDSGCGKTSLLKTIMGFYPYEGEITLGNRPLRAVSKRALRSRIAYLPQQTLITAGSVRDNLTLGCRRPVEEREIGKVLALCTCDEWIAQLPDGLDTRLEEGGLRLSGGQRQMLSLARTLLRDADTILLDEVFSAIDKGRAAQILENLRRAYPEKTVIVISHEASVRQACGRSVSVP